MASLERAYINPDLGGPTQGMLEYIKLCCNILPVDVDNADARIYFQKHVTIATDRLVRFPIDQVEKEAMAGIPGMILDLGMRYVATLNHFSSFYNIAIGSTLAARLRRTRWQLASSGRSSWISLTMVPDLTQ